MRHRARIALPLLLLVAATPAAARPCAAIDADARAGIADRDLPALSRLVDEAARPDAGCTDAWRAALGDDVANAHVDAFFAAVEADGDAAAHLDLLEAGRRFGAPWQLILTLAEVRYERADYDGAAPLYEQAVATLARRAATGSDADLAALPDEAAFREIHARMATAALLASTYETPAVTRGDPASGLYAERYRGFTVAAVPVPVQFEFGTTAFTEKGRRAAEHLAAYLRASHLAAVTLVGHTDTVGGDADNMALSLARAEAVRAFVAAAGYSGRITVEGRGEREPFRGPDDARFAGDAAARDALDRRVELIR
ncbi:OmpA family protein [Oharaeibacter diazotrophicus]|uniref:OmpA family protein n=2 Tax=Oharaeibacter diazotrophicus TaxID=1920512 RepID=A0A4R6RMW0_9HYPH|nr:OmpA family protein [Oharaeibacter diazotrophicus]TDP87515.1 OmpA family protein [Oharaeibacter diazotrophicus]BBE70541.1 outer membrane porin F precursor [Pleomorphomonas sp. SM30]GLS77287.1 hypothetical protein GCM10007904_26240 [Oharaeibacter diazotrophicus]